MNITGSWISAITPSSITVSGPPNKLRQLLSTELFCAPGIRTKELAIFGPFHAPHIYGQDEEAIIKRLLGNLDPMHAKRRVRMPVISATSGKRVGANTFGGLLQAAVQDILIRPVGWDAVLKQLCEHADTAAGLEIIPVASTAEASIRGALQRAFQKQQPQRKQASEEGLKCSTTIHRVVLETDLMVGDGVYLVTEADLARPDLNEAVRGHLVEGKPLCTPVS
jgi:hypothetical protein